MSVRSLPFVIGALATLAISVGDVRAQTYRQARGTSELSVWGGGAVEATTQFGGLTNEEATGRRFAIVGLRYSRVVSDRKYLALEYTADLIPLAVAFGNRMAGAKRGTSYGAGLVPLGITVIGRPDARVKPFVGLTGGALMFNHEVPLPEATKFTFSADATAGVRIFTGPDARRSVSLGIKFHHLSNAGLSDTNRGLNNYVIFGGVSLRPR